MTKRFAVSLLVAAALAGCGGGGGEDTAGGGGGGLPGGGGGGTVTPGGSGTLSSYFVLDWSVFETAAAQLRNSTRYQRQNNSWYRDANDNGRQDSNEPTLRSFPLASTRVDYAQAAGLTGRGQILSIVDSGFLPTHETVAGRVIEGTSGLPVTGHGTFVASVAAGLSSSFVGVAPGAQLALGAFTSQSTLAAATDRARQLGAVAQNNSWGYELNASSDTFSTLFSGTSGQNYLRALRDYTTQSQLNPEPGVVVFAASNDQTRTTSTIMEALPAFDASLEDGWLAVISGVPVFNDDGILSATRISAPCAQAARWCIAADGTWEAATINAGNLNDINDYNFSIGTSFAAPMVSGALALLAEAFPDLNPQQLRVRLLASADDDFAGFTSAGTVTFEGFVKDYSAEWGHGFLDLRAALAPIGTPVIATAAGGTVAVDTPLAVSGGAYGDAVVRALEGHSVLVTDALSADFSMPADSLVARSGARALAPRLMASAVTGIAGGVDLLSSYGQPRMTFVEDDLTLSVMSDMSGADGEYGLGLSRGFDLGAARLDLGISMARDRGTLAGLTDAGSDMVALDLGLSAALGEAGFLRLSGQMGLAQPRGTVAFAELDDSRFDSLSLDIGRENAFQSGDRLTLGLALPVAMTSGRAAIDLPMTRSSGEIVFDRVGIDLAPSARQMDLSLNYDMDLGRGTTMTLGAVHAVNHGHVAGAHDTAGVLALRIRF